MPRFFFPRVRTPCGRCAQVIVRSKCQDWRATTHLFAKPLPVDCQLSPSASLAAFACKSNMSIMQLRLKSQKLGRRDTWQEQCSRPSTSTKAEDSMACQLTLITCAGNEICVSTKMSQHNQLAELEDGVVDYLDTVTTSDVFGCEVDPLRPDTQEPLQDPMWNTLTCFNLVVRECMEVYQCQILIFQALLPVTTASSLLSSTLLVRQLRRPRIYVFHLPQDKD